MIIPQTLEEATSVQWLSQALDAPVTAVTIGELDVRVSTNAPIDVEFSDGSHRKYWIKGYFSEIGRAHQFAGVPEALFYRDLAARTGVRTLRPAFAGADPATMANVLVTEDVLGEGAQFLSSLSDYSADQAAETLEQLAILHASTWLDPACADVSWLAPRTAEYAVVRGIAEIEENFAGPIGAGVPERVRDAKQLYNAFKLVADAVAAAQPWCVIHGDAHIGNVFVDGGGRPSFLDWQLVQRGPWFLDVGYHLAAVLTVEDRRANEEALVRHYLDRLAAAGVELPYNQETWRGLRRGIVHGFYLWGITLKVDPRKTTVLLERLGTAAADHDALKDIYREVNA